MTLMSQYYNLIWLRHVVADPSKRGSVILASYPKSGNTWFRLVIANAINELEGACEAIDFKKLYEILPEDRWVDDLKNRWPYQEVPYFVKTHRKYRAVYARSKKIFLVRNPLDTMVSYYAYQASRADSAPAIREGRYLPRNVGTLRNEYGAIRDFIHDQMPEWCEHYSSWKGVSDVMVHYEKMKIDPVGAIGGALTSVGIRLADDILERAVDNSSLERMKKVEEQQGLSDKMPVMKGKFVRSGAVGQWKHAMTADDVRCVEKYMEEYGICISDFVID